VHRIPCWYVQTSLWRLIFPLQGVPESDKACVTIAVPLCRPMAPVENGHVRQVAPWVSSAHMPLAAVFLDSYLKSHSTVQASGQRPLLATWSQLVAKRKWIWTSLIQTPRSETPTDCSRTKLQKTLSVQTPVQKHLSCQTPAIDSSREALTVDSPYLWQPPSAPPSAPSDTAHSHLAGGSRHFGSLSRPKIAVRECK
jgi:hypothetical protein